MTEPWPRIRTDRLLAVDPAAKEKHYHGPYNMILTSVFNEPQYEVSPQAWPMENTKAMDYAVEYLVEIDNGVPVLGFEIKRAGDIRFKERRSAADEQIRDRFEDLKHSIVTPTFYIVSAIGTVCCIYEYTKESGVIIPANVAPPNSRFVEDSAPAERWNIDLSTLEGRVRLNEYFMNVKQMCNQLKFEH